MAVVIHHNGGPRQDVINRLARLRQFQPAVPALICSSCYEPGQWDTLPRGVKGWLSWPEGQAQLQATLNRWRSPGAGLLRRLQSVWSHLALPVKTRGGSAAASELATTTDSGPGKAGLEARFFGCWSLKAGGHCLPWMSSEMNRAMLAYMIFHHDERILRRKVIDGFWPDSSEDSARNCLNVAISSIRRYLKDNMAEAPAIHFRENAYSAALGPALYTDVHEFLRLWGHAQAMERANRPDEALNAYRRAGQLYKGEFLECITREISWVESMRSKLREVYLAVLDRLGELLVERELYREAITACQQMLEIDDCIERAHNRLMACYSAIHSRGAALRQYHRCCKALESKLGARPSRETQELLEEIQG